MTFSPDLPVTHLKGVGPKLAATLERLGIYRLVDLLLHLPYRYQDRTRITPAVDIVPGEAYLVQGQIINCQILFGKRRSLNVVVEDQTGRVSLRFFHFSKYQQANFKAAGYVRAFGEFRFFGRQLTSAHPEYELFDAEPSTIEGEYLPVYPATQGLAQSRLRRLQETLCAMPWPQDEGLPYSKLQFLHRPPAGIELAEIETIRQALAEDELTAYYLVMKGRALRRMQSNAPLLEQTSGRGRELLAHLGFKLTQAQARVTAEILNDLAKPVPMLRLVQGDVGSGKTVVAAFAAIRAAEHGCQTAVMAPTELLAEQHFINFSNWLAPLNISVVLLTGGLTAAEQRQRLAAVEQGDALVIIGTHALFQRRVVFNNLALSIVDEQHRFGVHQRMALQMKGDQGRQPHQLIMTATPIPRTLTMALYADMEVSMIDELPQGRQPITTHTVDAERRAEVATLMATNIARGQQGYWVCNLIDVSDEIDAMSLEALEPIVADSLRQVRYGILHGRMNSDEKTEVMARFKAGHIQLLLATTVVEVGVDHTRTCMPV
ncbi:MAG: ATP-dependent DNA helicase RecG [Pseudomonadota bacterium]